MFLLFKKIRWRNFISTGQTWVEIELDKCQNSLIVGENGAGKSTLLDAISFALYGKPFRNVLKGQLLNTINNKDCLVELEFQISTNSYMVRRGIKPNIFEVYQDGKLLNQNSDAKEYQHHFEKHIFKLNQHSFGQIVVLGSASFVPFMQLDKADRRKLIDDLLDTEIFSTMGVILKEKVSSNKESITQVNAYITATERNIEVEKRRTQEKKQDANVIIAEKNSKIVQYSDQIKLAEKQLAESRTSVSKLTYQIKDEVLVRNRLAKLKAIELQLVTKKSNLQQHVNFITKNDICPTCRQSINGETKQHALHREKDIDTLNKAIADIGVDIAEQNIIVQDLNSVKESISKIEYTMRDLNNKIIMWNDFKSDIKRDIDNVVKYKEKMDSDSGDVAQSQHVLESYLKEREQLAQVRVINDFAGVLLKDSGIKTRIVREYIPIINQLVNKYLASMDFFVGFELDENFQEKVKSRFRDEFSYNSFSQGEKARLDLALLFTWRAIAKMRNSASTNLLILDEVFDGSLDSQGAEELLKILHTLTAGNNAFVITHRTDAFIDKFQRVLRFEKHKNFSQLVENK